MLFKKLLLVYVLTYSTAVMAIEEIHADHLMESPCNSVESTVCAKQDAMQAMAFMPKIDVNKIPKGFAGVNYANLEQTTKQANLGDGDGQFRISCDFSHMNFDDPIVYANQRGASHLHMYFGNTNVDYLTTAKTLETSGKSTCHGGIVNRSGYWVPAMIDTRDGGPVVPYDIVVYYKTGYVVPKKFIQAPPVGLKMIAGDHKNKIKNGNPFVTYQCKTNEGEVNQSTIPQDCMQSDWVSMKINFPQCWDGVNLDSADHKSHMAYAHNDYPAENNCPATHPVAIPAISYLLRYQVKFTGQSNRWRLASDMYDESEAGGLSGHGDWFSGWDEKIMKLIVNGCLNEGLDCGSDFLPDGRVMKSTVTWEEKQAFDQKLRSIPLPK